MCSVSPRAGTTRGVDVHPQLVRGADAELTARVQEIHAGSRGTYGAPRIHAELAEAGVAVGRKRVARVMRAAGIAGVSRRRGPRTTRREVQDRPAPDRVERRFEADAPNRLWVADITYIPTLAGFLYLAIVLDVFSRRVVGWAMAAHLRTELVTEALEMAVAQRRPDAVIHHSDQGCQYTSLAFGARCQEWDVALSMGSVGDCFDNAMAESFFATLECELLARTTLSTHAEARAAVFEFVEGWYNTRRRHSALGYASPLEFERLHAAGPVDGARSVDAFRAPTSLLEPGTPAPTRVVTGVLLETHGGGMMTHRRTARLRLRKPDSCCETCRLVEETNAGLLGRRASLGPAGCRNARRITGLRSVSPRGAVEVPGLWTPGRRRAEFEGRRGGRPQPVGNLAGDRCRPCLRWGREIPTLPQRIIIIDTDTETTFIKDVP